MTIKSHATIEDLYSVPDNGKAEIVRGKLIRMNPNGGGPGRTAGKIFASLNAYEEQHGGGYAFTDNVGFIVRLPDRDSFSPDAGWYTGDVEEEALDFLEGAPLFAVEVRSKHDYSAKAERAIAKKIQDYFAAGTLAVWDVDLLGNDVIKVYRASAPTEPTIYRRGDGAEAELAVPGWRLPVDALFK